MTMDELQVALEIVWSDKRGFTMMAHPLFALLVVKRTA
jgi:hypothetical protein